MESLRGKSVVNYFCRTYTWINKKFINLVCCPFILISFWTTCSLFSLLLFLLFKTVFQGRYLFWLHWLCDSSLISFISIPSQPILTSLGQHLTLIHVFSIAWYKLFTYPVSVYIMPSGISFTVTWHGSALNLGESEEYHDTLPHHTDWKNVSVASPDAYVSSLYFCLGRAWYIRTWYSDSGETVCCCPVARPLRHSLSPLLHQALKHLPVRNRHSVYAPRV